MTETIVIMNLCRLTGPDGRWLMQERSDPWYPGLIFPGGHLEAGESFSESMIREFYEETGLTLVQPHLRGVRHWVDDGVRYMVLLYTADAYTGTLHASAEGNVFWMTREEVLQRRTVRDFGDMLTLFDSDTYAEQYYRKTPDGQITEFFP